jgi:hypothetical protein
VSRFGRALFLDIRPDDTPSPFDSGTGIPASPCVKKQATSPGPFWRPPAAGQRDHQAFSAKRRKVNAVPFGNNLLLPDSPATLHSVTKFDRFSTGQIPYLPDF